MPELNNPPYDVVFQEDPSQYAVMRRVNDLNDDTTMELVSLHVTEVAASDAALAAATADETNLPYVVYRKLGTAQGERQADYTRATY